MKKIKTLLLSIITTAACVGVMSVSANAAPYQDKKFSFAQPDDSKVDVIGTGDEFYQHIETEDGYTLVRNDDGWICYAKLNEDGTELEATDVVYTGNNDNVPEGLEKHLDITQESVDKKIKEEKERLSVKNESAIDNMVKPKTNSLMANDGKKRVVGLTILIDFPDEQSTISYDEINNFFNQKGYKGYGNNGSVYDFFYDISGGEVEYNNRILKCDEGNKFYYRAKHNKSYYDRKDRSEVEATRLLIDEVKDWMKENEDKINLSGVSKNENETYTVLNLFYAGTPSQGFEKGLWPHKCYAGNQKYQISNIGSELSLGTVCHETGHALLGYDDLYNYTTSRKNGESGPLMVGTNCLMGTGSYNENSKNPAPPNPYLRYYVSKFKGNVTDLNSISDGTVLSLKSDDKGFSDVYKWSNPDNKYDCMFIENIQKSGRYAGVKEEGLFVWNGYLGGYGNIGIVYANNPTKDDDGHVFSAKTVNMINRVVTPNAKWYSGKYSGLNLSNISDSKKEMTFQKGCTVKPGFYNVRGEIFNVINEAGETTKGFKEIDSKMYYFDEKSGDAALGLTTINNKKYYFDETTGEMKKGFIEVDNKKYYFDKDTGERKDGWLNIDGKTYYSGKDGIATGLEVINDENYYFDEDGVYNPDKKGFVLTGDYKVLDDTDYNLDCKNQVTIGEPVNLEAGIIGAIGNNKYQYTYKYSVSYRSVQAPAEEFQSKTPMAFDEFQFIPKNLGYCSITVTAKGRDGNTYTDTICLEVNPKLKIDSFMINNKKVSVNSYKTGIAGNEVEVKALVEGGYRYDDKKNYDCDVEYYENINENNSEKQVFTDLPSPQLKFTPTKKGIYKFKFKVKDVLGSASAEVWYLVH